jgi:hypothetical protein
MNCFTCAGNAWCMHSHALSRSKQLAPADLHPVGVTDRIRSNRYQEDWDDPGDSRDVEVLNGLLCLHRYSLNIYFPSHWVLGRRRPRLGVPLILQPRETGSVRSQTRPITSEVDAESHHTTEASAWHAKRGFATLDTRCPFRTIVATAGKTLCILPVLKGYIRRPRTLEAKLQVPVKGREIFL